MESPIKLAKTLEFKVQGAAVPKPSMSQAARRPRKNMPDALRRYREWQDLVRLAFIKAAQAKRWTQNEWRFDRCAFGIEFAVVGHPDCDLTNLIKGIEDALKDWNKYPVRLAFKDDCLNHVVAQDPMRIYWLCDSCEKRTGAKDCGAVMECRRAFSIIRLREVPR